MSGFNGGARAARGGPRRRGGPDGGPLRFCFRFLREGDPSSAPHGLTFSQSEESLSERSYSDSLTALPMPGFVLLLVKSVQAAYGIHNITTTEGTMISQNIGSMHPPHLRRCLARSLLP